MSFDAASWAIRYSPYTGMAFTVHVMIGDSVNDQNRNEFWMAFGKLAKKARTTRKSVSEIVARLVEDGFLVVLEDHRTDSAGKPSRYGFLFPDVPAVYDTRGVTRGDTPLSREVTGGVTRGVTNTKEPKNELKTPPPSATPLSEAKKPKPRDLVFDALIDSWGIGELKVKAERGRVAAAAKQIREAEPDYDDEAIAREIIRRARRYRRAWPDIDFTPTALASHWSRFSLGAVRKLEGS